MTNTRTLFLLTCVLLAMANAYAADSLLRVTCDGDAMGAEVQVNGKFKGECPLDIAVQEGEQKLRVVKTLDASRERIFEQTVRLGDGVVKKVEVALSAPQLSAAGQQSAREARRQDEVAMQKSLQLAEAGNAVAMFTVGYNYAIGKGVAQNDVQAVHWYRKAAEGGQSGAMLNLATRYANGKGIEQSDEQAVIWYRKAAEAGQVVGMTSLGYNYYIGKGVEQSSEQAVFWFRKAAEAGYPLGMFNLGVHLATGKGVAQNETEAIAWYRKAAEKGYASAISELKRRGLQ